MGGWRVYWPQRMHLDDALHEILLRNVVLAPNHLLQHLWQNFLVVGGELRCIRAASRAFS